MKYIFFISIGIFILIVTLIYLIRGVIQKTKRKTSSILSIGINLFVIGLLILILFAAITGTVYNHYYEKGSKLVSANKYDEAIIPFNNALSIRMKLGNASSIMDENVFGFPLFFSSEINLRMTLGLTYKQLKKYSDAIKQYEYVVKMDDDNFNAIAGLAECYLIVGNSTEATNYYRKLTKIKPQKSFSYHINMGKAFMVLFDYEKAILHFRDAAKFDEEKEVAMRYIELCKKHMAEKKSLTQPSLIN